MGTHRLRVRTSLYIRAKPDLDQLRNIVPSPAAHIYPWISSPQISNQEELKCGNGTQAFKSRFPHDSN